MPIDNYDVPGIRKTTQEQIQECCENISGTHCHDYPEAPARIAILMEVMTPDEIASVAQAISSACISGLQHIGDWSLFATHYTIPEKLAVEACAARTHLIRLLGKVIPVLPDLSPAQKKSIEALFVALTKCIQWLDSAGNVELVASIEVLNRISPETRNRMLVEFKKYFDESIRPTRCSHNHDHLTRMIDAARDAGVKLPLPVAKMAEALKDGDIHVRKDAIKWLGAMGPDAQSAIPVLTRKLDEANDEIRLAARGAIRKIIDQQA